jgi:5-methylcytosine-specific restriction endonuclease McrA
MRPVSKGQHPPAYIVPATIAFTGTDGAVIQRVLGTTTPTVAQCLGLWSRTLRPGAPSRKGYKGLMRARKLIIPHILSIYKQAAMPLTTTLGDICSYCETRIPGTLDVEHAVPKALYPSFAVAWENLLLACGPCNVAKRDRPDWQTSCGWVGSRQATEKQCRDEVRKRHFVWPDLTAHSFRRLSIVLYHDPQGNNNWIPLPLPAARNPAASVTSTDIATRTVRATFPAQAGQPALTDVLVRALVVPYKSKKKVPPISGNSSPSPRGGEMVALCKLNDLGKLILTYDRRVFHRTLAWFDVLGALQMLQALPNPAQFNAAWPMIGRTARNTGFFSVWVRLLDAGTDPAGQNLATRFINDFGGLFPATNAQAVP